MDSILRRIVNIAVPLAFLSLVGLQSLCSIENETSNLSQTQKKIVSILASLDTENIRGFWISYPQTHLSKKEVAEPNTASFLSSLNGLHSVELSHPIIVKRLVVKVVHPNILFLSVDIVRTSTLRVIINVECQWKDGKIASTNLSSQDLTKWAAASRLLESSSTEGQVDKSGSD